jgi:hypothetical protein
MDRMLVVVATAVLFFISCGGPVTGNVVSCGFPCYLMLKNQSLTGKDVSINPAHNEHFVTSISRDTCTVSPQDSLIDTIQYNWTFTNYSGTDCMLIDGYKYQLIIRVFRSDSLVGYYTINPVERFLNSMQYSSTVPGEVRYVFQIP